MGRHFGQAQWFRRIGQHLVKRPLHADSYDHVARNYVCDACGAQPAENCRSTDGSEVRWSHFVRQATAAAEYKK